MPGYLRINGNEKVDKLVKMGAYTRYSIPSKRYFLRCRKALLIDEYYRWTNNYFKEHATLI